MYTDQQEIADTASSDSPAPTSSLVGYKLPALFAAGLLAACVSPREPDDQPATIPLSPPSVSKELDPVEMVARNFTNLRTERDLTELIRNLIAADPEKLPIQKLGVQPYFAQGGRLHLEIQDPANPRRLDIDSANLQQNMGWVVGFLRQTRIEGNPLISEIYARVQSGEATRVELAAHRGLWLAPANNSVAIEQALLEYHTSARPLGTLSEMQKLLAKLNSADLPCIPVGEEKFCPVSDIRSYIRKNPGYTLIIDLKGPRGEKEQLQVNADNLDQQSDKFRFGIFQLRLQNNPVLRDLQVRRANGDLAGFEYAILTAVSRHPDDFAAVYTAAAEQLAAMEKQFPGRVGPSDQPVK